MASLTNITAEHRSAFEALTSGDYANFALFSCFADGQPSAAICAVTEQAGEYPSARCSCRSPTPCA